MSRPQNMLRTRRKDSNIKPNRRLDRKSSRGMIYENEELRLKTININAEVESRQSDIKKLKRENEMLKKGLWYLRDEYDKLEKIIKDKKIDFSSSSTTCSSSSDSESCGSFSEGSEEVETTQNLKNVQRTNMKNMQVQFDHLSVVTEETSAENSELNSARVSLIKENWTSCEDNILQPDQSYPDFSAKPQTVPESMPPHFFSPIKQSKSFDDNRFYQVQDVIYPGEFYENQYRGSTGNMMDENPNVPSNHSENFQHDSGSGNCVSQKIVRTHANCFYQNMVLVPTNSNPQIEMESMEKSATDLIVKIDNQNFIEENVVFNNTPSRSTFSNGGNLEELLNDIESISQKGMNNQTAQYNSDVDGYNLHPEAQVEDRPIGFESLVCENGTDSTEKPFKSELNVVLMPNPMPLIGIDKYKNIQRSLESLDSKPIEELSVSQQNLCLIPPPKHLIDHNVIPSSAPVMSMRDSDTNPFFFGNLKDNYVNADYFSMRYNPDNFFAKENGQKENEGKIGPRSGSKTNLLDQTSSEHVSSENEENLKFKTNKPERTDDKNQHTAEQSKDDAKPSKMSIRKKVSIHFKGKKEQSKKPFYCSDPIIPKTPTERKQSIFERFNDKDKDKNKVTNLKSSISSETRKSAIESNAEPKTSSSESKSSSEKRISMAPDKKEKGPDKKVRKSTSVSPDRKHVQMKDEANSKQRHRKHKKFEKGKMRRSSVLLTEPKSFRERSFSVCTEKSNNLGLGLGLGFGSSMYFEEDSDPDRTNSMSSCETTEHARKMSTIPNAPLSGKLPWCGCWGNGCL